ncbi:MAG: hypothetical protein K0S09_2224 [Sphingobacteriaceae bacterium]|jgi:hypothetical protein|nr:hypothetical protein [Sphingobacteriaceae bacterium]
MKENEATLPPGRLRWVESLSRLLDDKFRIPGTNFRFGLDPLLNLIPIAGDLSGFLISAALVATMAKHGVSRKVLILMSLNILLDATIGAIPFIGQIFDFVYKANTKNIKLLKEHYEEGRHKGSGTGIVVLILIVFAIFFVLLMYGVWKLADWLWGMM